MLKPRNIPDIFLGALLACAIFALGFSVALSFYPPQENRSAQKTEQKGNGSITDDRLADYTLALDWLNFFFSSLDCWSVVGDKEERQDS